MRSDPDGVPEPTRSGRGIRSRGLLVAATGLAVLVSVGCSGPAKAGGTVTETITVAAVPGVDTAPLYLAQKDGFFAAEGMRHLVIKPYPNEPAEIAALRSGQVDIAAS